MYKDYTLNMMGGAYHAQNAPNNKTYSEESRRVSELKLFRKTAAWMAAVLMCSALATTAMAAEQEQTVEISADEYGKTQRTNSEAVYTEVNEVVYATAPVNIRTGPGTGYSILGVLRTGASIRRIAVGSNGWSKVIYSGKTAYMVSAYISATRPAGYTDNLDDTEIRRQVAIANGLNPAEYTAESWAAMQAALDEACEAMVGYNQIAADQAAEDLKNAIAALVRMDYTALEAVLSDVQKLLEENPQNGLWGKVLTACEEAKGLMTGGDQAAVDAAASNLTQLYAELQTLMEGEGAPEIVVQQVPVEVPPSDDYCNIAKHRVWPVLFFASLAVNGILVVVMVAYVSNKKRNQRDDTPLVDYDIYDDTL